MLTSSKEVVEILIAHDADLEATTTDTNMTALDYAVSRINYDVVCALLRGVPTRTFMVSSVRSLWSKPSTVSRTDITRPSSRRRVKGFAEFSAVICC